MKAIILAGGKGWRLKPLTDKIAKPMIEVADKPTLEHVVNLLKKYGIRDFVMALGYLPETVSSYFGDGSKFGIKIKYLIEDEPLGTAGAVSRAKRYIKEDFIVTAGDVLRKMDINAFLSKHKEVGSIATIGLFKVFKDNPPSRVIVGRDGFIVNFVEHPRKKIKKNHFVWSNDSFYVFKPEIFNYIPKNIPEGMMVDFGKDVFPAMIKKGIKINTFVGNKYIVDIGTFEGLGKARRTFVP